MILQIGKDTEEQLQVPLTAQADLSQYQPEQSNPNLRVQFGSVYWTLKTVTFKLSDSGTTITLEQAVIGSAAADTSNVPGVVSFLVPQDTTAATFVLLPGHLTPGATTQATIPFQIP